jgi:hypothetical protein
VATAIRANLCERKRLASKPFMTSREGIFDFAVAGGVQTFCGSWSKEMDAVFVQGSILVGGTVELFGGFT